MSAATKKPKRIQGQVIYVGPFIRSLGLNRGTIFRDGIHEHLYSAIALCPSLGALFVPVTQYAVVRRELNFDLARNMCGTAGTYVEFYREVEKWLGSQSQQQPQTKQTSSGITLKEQHA